MPIPTLLYSVFMNRVSVSKYVSPCIWLRPSILSVPTVISPDAVRYFVSTPEAMFV